MVDKAHRGHEPVYLTRRDRLVATIVDADQLRQLLEDAQELAAIRAVDAPWDRAPRQDPRFLGGHQARPRTL